MKQGEMMKLPIFIGRRMDARIYFIIHSHQPLIKSHVRQPRHPPACLLMWHHEEERYEKPYLDLYFDRKAERKLESSEKARFTSKQEMFQGGFKLNSALLETSFFSLFKQQPAGWEIQLCTKNYSSSKGHLRPAPKVSQSKAGMGNSRRQGPLSCRF